jgi:hypothetical protein
MPENEREFQNATAAARDLRQLTYKLLILETSEQVRSTQRIGPDRIAAFRLLYGLTLMWDARLKLRR